MQQINHTFIRFENLRTSSISLNFTMSKVLRKPKTFTTTHILRQAATLDRYATNNQYLELKWIWERASRRLEKWLDSFNWCSLFTKDRQGESILNRFHNINEKTTQIRLRVRTNDVHQSRTKSSHATPPCFPSPTHSSHHTHSLTYSYLHMWKPLLISFFLTQSPIPPSIQLLNSSTTHVHAVWIMHDARMCFVGTSNDDKEEEARDMWRFEEGFMWFLYLGRGQISWNLIVEVSDVCELTELTELTQLCGVDCAMCANFANCDAHVKLLC